MSLSTNIFDFSLTRGDSLSHQVTVEVTDESAKDVTGASVSYTIKRDSRDGVQVVQKTLGSGITLTSPITGVMTITLSPTDTMLDPGRRYFYDCQVTISGFVQTVQAGQITVEGEVTS